MEIDDLLKEVDEEKLRKDDEKPEEKKPEETEKKEQVKVDEIVKPSWTTSLPKKYRAEAEKYNDLGSYLDSLIENQKPAQEEEDVWNATYSKFALDDNQELAGLFKKVKDSGATTTQAEIVLSGIQEASKNRLDSLKEMSNRLINEEKFETDKFREKVKYISKNYSDLYAQAEKDGTLFHPFVVSLIDKFPNVRGGKLITSPNNALLSEEEEWQKALEKAFEGTY